jgi:hypothetical protein
MVIMVVSVGKPDPGKIIAFIGLIIALLDD